MNTREQKKQLKTQVKALREQGYQEYINLATASVEDLTEYLEQAKGWNPTVWEDEDEDDVPIQPADFSKINSAKTLSQLGQAIAGLQGFGAWAEWEMKLWTKNGECRIYLKDKSYTNPKDRGYLLISPNGECKVFDGKGFPSLPSLPTVENDLKAVSLTPEDRAAKALDRQFGVGAWTQADLDDELERDEYN